MAPLIVAGLISAGAGIANSLITNSSNNQSYSDSVNLMREQNKINRANWIAQNAYNSPAAQMARYAAAGLNPNIIYGNSQQVSSGNSQEMPTVQASQFHRNVPALDLNFVNTAINAALAESQVRKNNSEAKGQEIDNQYNSSTLGARIDMLNQELAKVSASKDLLLNQINESKLSQENKSIVNNYLDDYQRVGLELQNLSVKDLRLRIEDAEFKVNQLNPSLKDKLLQEINNLRASFSNIMQDTYLKGAQTLNADESRNLIANQADAFCSQKKVLDETVNKIAQSTKLTKKEVDNFVWIKLLPLANTALQAGLSALTKGLVSPAPNLNNYNNTFDYSDIDIPHLNL